VDIHQFNLPAAEKNFTSLLTSQIEWRPACRSRTSTDGDSK